MAGFAFDKNARHQCEHFQGNGEGEEIENFQNCTLHPGHKNSLTVKEFGMQHLPPQWRKKEYMEWIGNHIARTGKVVVKGTSLSRPSKYKNSDKDYPLFGEDDPRTGTGFVNFRYTCPRIDPCPCLLCKSCIRNQSTHSSQECFYYLVSTATHVVYDIHEAKKTCLELRYDDEDSKTKDAIKRLYGVNVIAEGDGRLNTDTCLLLCVTHDPVLAKELNLIIDNKPVVDLPKEPLGIMISHPHGVSKRISLGRVNRRSYRPPTGTNPSARIEMKLPSGSLLRLSKEQIEKKCVILDIVKRHENVDKNSGTDDVFCLTCDVTALLPSGAYIETRSSSGGDCFDSGTLPADTELVTEDGRRYLVKDVEIFSGDEHLLSVPFCFGYLLYDMAGCPGSSGALVLSNLPNCSSHNITHCSVLEDDERPLSMSGLNIFWMRDESLF